MNKQLLTIQEAASLLGVSTKTLRRWEAKGIFIPERTAGNQRRYAKEDITAFKKSQKRVVNSQSQTSIAQKSETSSVSTKPDVPHLPSSIPQAQVVMQEVGVGSILEEAVSTSIPNTDFHIPAKTHPDFHIAFKAPVQITQAADSDFTQAPLPSFVREEQPLEHVPEISQAQNMSNSSYAPRIFLSVALIAFIGSLVVFEMSASFKTTKQVSNKIGQGVAFVSAQFMRKESLSDSVNKTENEAVLAADVRNRDIKLKVNVPSIFSKDAQFLTDLSVDGQLSVSGSALLSGGVITNNADIDAGTGELTASNVIYSITSGTGIAVTGGQTPTITNTGILSLNDITGEVTLATSGILSLTTGDDAITISASEADTLASVTGRGATTSTAVTFGGGVTISSLQSGVVINSSGTLTSESALAAIRGGTGISSYVVGDLLYADSTTTLARRAIGADGEVLIVQSGVPIWLDPSTAGFNHFQRVEGSLIPRNITDDILLGATSTASANVRLGGTTGSDSFINTGGNFGVGVANPTAKVDVNGSINVIGIYRIGGVAGVSESTATCVTTTGGIVTGTGPCLLGTEQWEVSNGLLYPGISSLDVAFGGKSTEAAKIAFINMNTGTPTASVSAGGTGGIFITASGNIETTARQSLTLGGGSTGNIILSGFGTGFVKSNANGVLTTGVVDLATSDVAGILPVANGGTGSNTLLNLITLGTHTTGAYIATITGDAQIQVSGSGGETGIVTLAIGINSIGDTQLEYNTGQHLTLTATPTFAGLTLNGAFTVSGARTGEALVQIDETGDQDIFTASASGVPKFTISRSGNLAATGSLSGLTGLSSSGTITFSDLGTGVLYSNSGVVTSEASLDETRGGTGLTSYATGDLLYASGVDTLARRAVGSDGEVLTVVGGLPSWTSAGAAGINLFQRNEGAIAPLHISDDILLGNIATSSALVRLGGTIGANSFFNTGGNVGIGTTNPAVRLDVSGDINVQNAGTIQYTGSGVKLVNSSGTNFGIQTNNTYRVYISQNGNVGVGTTSPFGLLNVDGKATGKSLAILNETGDQAIFTASASGTTRFVIANNGTITASAYGEGVAKFSSAGVISSGALDLASGSNYITGILPIANGGTGANTLNDLITLGAHTTGDYVASVTGNSQITVSGSGSEDAAVTLAIAGDSIGDTQLAFNTGQNLTTADSPSFTGLTVSGLSSGVVINTNGLLSSEAQLSVTRGGTGLASVTTGDLLYGSASNTYSRLAIGGSGQVLTVSSGLPAWIDASDLSNSYWQRNQGALSPTDISDDILLGNIASSSALVRLGGTTGAHSFFNTGGNVGIGTTTPGATLQVGTNLRFQDFSGTSPTIWSANSSAALFLGSTAVGHDTYLRGNNLYFTTGSSVEAMRIDSSGNVGIGTTAPLAKLDVAGSASFSGNVAFTGANTTINQLNGGTLSFNTSAGGGAGTSRLFIQNDGNIGIGTTAPAAQLNIKSDNANWLRLETTSGFSNQIALNNGSTRLLSIATNVVGNNFMTNAVAGSASLNANATLHLGVSDALKGITVISSGNVGLGTVSPIATLDVRGQTGTSPVASFSGTTSLAALFVDNNGVGDLFTASKSGATKFVINNAGNVGIGVRMPSYLLDVQGGSGIVAQFSGRVIGADAVLTNEFVTLNQLNNVTGSAQYWQRNNGTVSPLNITDDLLVGGIASSSALVRVGGTTGAHSFFNTGGNVGIGTTAPTGALEIKMDSLTSATDAQLFIDREANSLGAFRFGAISSLTGSRDFSLGYNSSVLEMRDHSNGFRIIEANNAPISLHTNNIERFRIDESGNVGIGSLGPIGLLNVDGKATGKSLAIFNQTGDQDVFTASVSGSTKFVIKNDGNVGIGTSAPGTKLEVVGDFKAGAGSGTNTWTANTGGSGNFNLATSYMNILSVPGSGAVTLNSYTGTAISLAPGSITAMTLLSTGNVGIGTTTPFAKLDVAGSASFSGNLAFTGAATTISQLNGGTLSFNTSAGGGAGTSRMFIQNDGNVGVGTTSPQTSLHVVPTVTGGGIRIEGTSGTVTPAIALYLGSTQYSTFSTAAAGGAGLNDSITGDTVLKNAGANAFLFGTNNIERMRISSGGNVGIGTTAPTAKLDVNGNLNVSGYATASGSLAVGYTSVPGGPGYAVFSGNVGIGTTNPGAKLHVTGTDEGIRISNDTSYLSFYNSANNVRSGYLQMTTTASYLVNSLNTPFYFYTNNQRRLTISADGNVGIGTTSPVVTLDVRGNSGTSPIASFSGTTSFAGMVVDNNGVGDIFTASKSGATKFTINNDGSIRANNYSTGIAQFDSTGLLTSAALDLEGGATSIDGILPVANGGTGQATLADLITLTSDTVGNYVAHINNGAGITGGGAGSEGGTPTLAINLTTSGTTGASSSNSGLEVGVSGLSMLKGCGDNEILAWDEDTSVWQCVTIGGLGAGGDITAVGDATTGEAFTSGGTSGTSLYFYDAQGRGQLTIANLTGVQTYTLPDASGDICLSSGNCANAGGGITGAGSANFLARFSDTDSIESGSIFDNGNVGIGTTSPLALFHVNGTSGTTPAASFSAQTSFATLITDNSGVGDLFTASKSGATKFVIANSGNVGINTNTPAAVLDVNGTTVIRNTFTQIVGGIQLFALDENGYLTHNSGTVTVNDNLSVAGGNSLSFPSGAGGISYLGYNGSGAAIDIDVTSTTNNSKGLDISHTGNISGTGYGVYANVTGTSTNNVAGYFSATGATSNYAAIFANGNVGIGVTNPGYKLEISGTFNTSSLYLSGTQVTSNATELNYLDGTTVTAGGIIYGDGGKLANMGAGNSGQVLLSGGAGSPTWADVSSLSGASNWQRLSGAISPKNITDSLNLGATATSSALVHLAGTSGENSFINTGNVGIGTTTPNRKLDVSTTGAGIQSIFQLSNLQTAAADVGVGLVFAGGINGSTALGRIAGAMEGASTADTYMSFSTYLSSSISERLRITSTGNVGIGTTAPIGKLNIQGVAAGKALAILNEQGNQAIFTASTSGVTKFTIANNGSLIATSSATTMEGFSFAADTVTTGSGMRLTANGLTTGTGFNLLSTSTALTSGNLMALDWSPASATTATGDLLSLNIGANGILGNIFNVKDNGSSIFSVSQSQITANLPVAFNSPGDVSIAYDINMTNPIASYVKSAAPLYLQAGEVFNSSDLTLATYNKGNVIVDSEAFVVNRAATISGQLVINNISTSTGTNLVIDANGLVYKDSSSQRYKENIQNFSMDLEKIMELQPKSYNYTFNGAYNIGFIAEEVDALGLTDLVIYDNEGRPDGVKYDKLPLYLLEIAKGQKSDLNNLATVTTQTGTVISSLSRDLIDTNTNIASIAGESTLMLNSVQHLTSEQQILKQAQDDHLLKMITLEQKVDATASDAAFIRNILENNGFTASSSAQFLSGQDLDLNNLTVSNDLMVLGRTTVTDLGVTGNVNIGLLAISGEGEINTIGEPLKIQSLAAAGVDILNGKVIIETDGTIIAEGKVVAKEVEAEKVTADKLSIITEADAASPSAVLSSSAGSITIETGQTKVDISTTALSTKSLIFASPDEPVTLGTKKKDADTFTITLSTPATKDVKVNWWIVN